jgi:hypothetical protein
MRMIMFVSMPVEVFNDAVRDGSAGNKIQKILAAQKPEAVYFADLGGQRTGVMVVDLAKASDIPALAEPWFLSFNAEVEIHPTMTPEDLGMADFMQLAKTWG